MLESFLKAAEELQVKGLTKYGEKEIPLHTTAHIEEDNVGQSDALLEMEGDTQHGESQHPVQRKISRSGGKMSHQSQDLDFCSLASPAEDQTALGNEERKQPLLYRDPALPMGWYVKVDRIHIAKHRYHVETCFFSPDGALLRSPSDVSSYLGGRLWVKDKSHRPPVTVAEMPSYTTTPS